jgi:hypothetical protein
MTIRKIKAVEPGRDREVPAPRREALFFGKRLGRTITGSSRLAVSSRFALTHLKGCYAFPGEDRPNAWRIEHGLLRLQTVTAYVHDEPTREDSDLLDFTVVQTFRRHCVRGRSEEDARRRAGSLRLPLLNHWPRYPKTSWRA